MGDSLGHQKTAATNGRGQCVLQVRAGDLQQGSWKFSEPTQVRGLQWRVGARVVRSSYELKVCCEGGDNVKTDWSCLATARLGIKVGQEDKRVREHSMPSHVFSSESKDVLMNHASWWWTVYDGYFVTIEADVHADPPLGVIAIPKLDVLVINGQPINMNKELLAAYSPFFKKLFFNPNFKEGADKEFKLEITDPPAGVHHFERLVALLHPPIYLEFRPIDDDCVEGVLHLANEFLMEAVEAICLDFLRTKSKKSALLKYGLAEKYGYNGLKAHVLRNLTKEDFAWDKFEANVRECFALGGGGDNDAFRALMRRFREL